MTIKINLKESILYLVISAFIIYSMWYQYVFGEISGIIPIFGVLILFFTFANLRLNLEFYRFLFGLASFLLFSFITGLFVTVNSKVFLDCVVNILQYCIPMIGIYVYIGTDVCKLKNIAATLMVAGLLIAISSLTKGIVTNTGAITIGNLNTNSLSSYIIVSLIAITYLFILNKNKKVRLFLVVIMVLETVSQFNAASRRGVVVLIFIILYMGFTIVQNESNNKKLSKLFLVLMVVSVISFIFINMQSLMEKLLILQRFTGSIDAGDFARKQYQAIAWEIFKSSPIFGGGLDAVRAHAGVYSHSLYYETLSATGVVGASILFIYIFGLLKKFFAFARYEEARALERSFSSISCWSIIAILLNGYAVVMIYDFYFYILIGLVASALHILYDSDLNESIKQLYSEWAR